MSLPRSKSYFSDTQIKQLIASFKDTLQESEVSYNSELIKEFEKYCKSPISDYERGFFKKVLSGDYKIGFVSDGQAEWSLRSLGKETAIPGQKLTPSELVLERMVNVLRLKGGPKAGMICSKARAKEIANQIVSDKVDFVMEDLAASTKS